MRENSNENSSIDESCLIESMEESHYPLPVIVPLYAELLLLISLLSGGFILPTLYKYEGPNLTDTFSAVIYLHVFIWMLITILTWYVKAEHKTSRILGYHEFYDATRHLHRVAFYFVSGGNVLMLIVSCVTHNFCLGGGISPCSINISFSPVNYLQLIIVWEVALALPFLTKHIAEVFRFNQKRLPPDVFRGHTAHQIEQREVIIGVRGSGNLERLLSHQADQLMTLNHRNEILYEQLFALTHRYQQSEES